MKKFSSYFLGNFEWKKEITCSLSLYNRLRCFTNNACRRCLLLIICVFLWNGPCWAEGIAVIVHPTNQVDSLTIAQLARIYKGKQKYWTDGKQMIVVNRPVKSRIRKDFYKKVLNSGPAKKFHVPGSPIVFKSMVQRSSRSVLRFVSRMPGTIAYIYLSEIAGTKGKEVKVLKIDETAPTEENIRKGKYVLGVTP